LYNTPRPPWVSEVPNLGKTRPTAVEEYQIAFFRDNTYLPLVCGFEPFGLVVFMWHCFAPLGILNSAPAKLPRKLQRTPHSKRDETPVSLED
jgi:hypothetical protein